MPIFKQSTPYTHQFGMVLSSDHATRATGKSTTLVVKLGKNGATGVSAGGALAEVDSTNLPGVYSIVFSVTDVNTLGSLSISATASGCDNTVEFHQVQTQLFPDLQLNAGGRVLIANNLQQNTALNGFVFPMANTAGQLTTGLSVTATRTLGAGGFAPCTNSVIEVGSGWYSINLSSSDLASATVGLEFTAGGANTLAVPLTPTP